ncbi:MAG: sodium ion-translocating decarboxylase subunit beta [Lentisphaeria bacterium]|jgi:oxaloacetate decarboxylase beta subunit
MKLRSLMFVAALLLAAGLGGLGGAAAAGTGKIIYEDNVFRMVEQEEIEPGRLAEMQTQGQDKKLVAPLIHVYYIWNQPATVYEVSVEPDKVVKPGRQLCILKIAGRSKAKFKAGESYLPEQVNLSLGQTLVASAETPILILRKVAFSHDSVVAGTKKRLKTEGLFGNLWKSTGLYELVAQTQNNWELGAGRLIMIAVGMALLWLAVSKGFEPLLLIPIGFGGIMANIPLAGISGPDGLLGLVYSVGIESGVFPLLIFLGIGAMTDFGPMIANPITALLAAAAQLGIFGALLGALLLSWAFPAISFSLKDAASIGIIGGADGPTAIYLTSKLSPNLLGAIAVAAYSYMALVPIIQPPIMKLLTTQKERKVRMTQMRQVSKTEKLVFPLAIIMLCTLILPDAAPLVGMLMIGNFFRECGVVERLSSTAQHALINIVTIFLGLSVGAKLAADQFLNAQTLGILLLGLVAFSVSTAGGVLLGKIMCKLSGGKINPLIGAAGVSAVPMAARVVNKVGQEADPHNFLLMHAMGPNVAGVIGSAVAAGVLLNALKML